MNLPFSSKTIHFQNVDGLHYLMNSVDNDSIDLVLTDPPYIISKPSGMNTHYNNVHKQNKKLTKTDQEWQIYKKENGILDDKNRSNFMKYGTIYGKRYCVQTMYGDWDETKFTMELLDEYIGQYFQKLKAGGTLILFCDLWKISMIRDIFEKYKFKQIRFIEWIKTNPLPCNSHINYLTNCREVAILGIKKHKATFNSSYDKGIYSYPISSKNICRHPNQKNIQLFEELIKKHSNENDIVLDTFLGSGTTLFASIHTNRQFKGCEIEQKYCDRIHDILVHKYKINPSNPSKEIQSSIHAEQIESNQIESIHSKQSDETESEQMKTNQNESNK